MLCSHKKPHKISFPIVGHRSQIAYLFNVRNLRQSTVSLCLNRCWISIKGLSTITGDGPLMYHFSMIRWLACRYVDFWANTLKQRNISCVIYFKKRSKSRLFLLKKSPNVLKNRCRIYIYVIYCKVLDCSRKLTSQLSQNYDINNYKSRRLY